MRERLKMRLKMRERIKLDCGPTGQVIYPATFLAKQEKRKH